MDNPEWPDLLIAYESALAEFERATTALTVALVNRDSPAEDLPELIRTEERARDLVVVTRMLMSAWREDQIELQALLSNSRGASN